MKTKKTLTLLALIFAALVNSPACIYCIMAAQNGISPDDPNGPRYSRQLAQWTPMTVVASQTNLPVAPTTNALVESPTTNALVESPKTNALVESPKTNSPVVVTFTNGAAVGFDVLAGYNINLAPELENNTNAAWADAQVNALIPSNIRALDRHEVTVDGFMIPAQMENGKVTEFLLSRNPPACCYGGVPQIHEWIKVRVKPPGVAPIEYTVARAHGILTVGAERLDGTLTSIYRMDADKVADSGEH